ncbi:trypsin-like serine peptidase [Allorhodopirellula solitaria]|uniref:Serine protease n=1 Tax=Allorhodopirellula solitaria TaxID=2527987 RepID=A0A5C5WYM9_9BACT|nr:trypsin-like peptidase domain-containing protein [Allorhodopirellula solitaria]TWT55698.1 Glutamyl endopeptidase precursor [Allorhodopirellula solitaria]
MKNQNANNNWLLQNDLLHPIGNPLPLLPRSIIGTDDRQACPDVTLNPFRWICQIESTGRTRSGATGTAYGTGCLIGRQTILTAAHNFFVGGQKVANRDVRITFGTDGDRSRPMLGAYAVTNVETPNAYNPAEIVSSHDIAVVGLRAPYPADQITNMGSQSWTEITASQLLHEQAFISGYPVDRPRTPPPTEPANAVQFWHVERVTDIASGELFYAVDTTIGQSGSPILAQLQLENGRTDTVAVGVHTNAASDLLPNRGLTIEGPIADFVRHHYESNERGFMA